MLDAIEGALGVKHRQATVVRLAPLKVVSKAKVTTPLRKQEWKIKKGKHFSAEAMNGIVVMLMLLQLNTSPSLASSSAFWSSIAVASALSPSMALLALVLSSSGWFFSR